MTSFAAKMINVTLQALMVGGMLAASSTASASTSISGTRNPVEALCEAESSNLVTLVTLKRGQPFVEIFRGSRLVKAQYAEKDYSYSGGILITSYNTGAVTQGGVSLRIRTYDQGNSNAEGFGHLTMKTGGSFSNSLMSCHIY